MSKKFDVILVNLCSIKTSISAGLKNVDEQPGTVCQRSFEPYYIIGYLTIYDGLLRHTVYSNNSY